MAMRPLRASNQQFAGLEVVWYHFLSYLYMLPFLHITTCWTKVVWCFVMEIFLILFIFVVVAPCYHTLNVVWYFMLKNFKELFLYLITSSRGCWLFVFFRADIFSCLALFIYATPSPMNACNCVFFRNFEALHKIPRRRTCLLTLFSFVDYFWCVTLWQCLSRHVNPVHLWASMCVFNHHIINPIPNPIS